MLQMEIGLDWWFCWITQRENYICVYYSCILKKKVDIYVLFAQSSGCTEQNK